MITGLTLAAVVGVLIAGVGVGLWLQRGTPQLPPPIAAAPAQTPPAPVIQAPTPIPAPEPAPVPPGSGAAPVVPEPVTTEAAPAPAPAPDQPPRVAKQLVFPASIERQVCPGADRAVVIADVESATPPRSVVLRAKGPGNGAPTSAAMVRNGNRWYAALGPFATPGTVTWQITVTDAAGVSAVGPAGSLRVTDCR